MGRNRGLRQGDRQAGTRPHSTRSVEPWRNHRASRAGCRMLDSNDPQTREPMVVMGEAGAKRK